MKASSDQLLAELSLRIRTGAPDEWREFAMLWSAFNAVYGGELDKRERARVMACIRRQFSNGAALRTLRAVTRPIGKILALPPGNMLAEESDPSFRAASRRCAALYRDKDQSPVGRLAAVAGVLYQVRCNLIHGSKDPDNSRDRMLVAQSLLVLRVLVPALEKQLTQ